MNFKFEVAEKITHKKFRGMTAVVERHCKQKEADEYGYQLVIYVDGKYKTKAIFPLEEIERDFVGQKK